jgi:hypothetical protein
MSSVLLQAEGVYMTSYEERSFVVTGTSRRNPLISLSGSGNMNRKEVLQVFY